MKNTILTRNIAVLSLLLFATGCAKSTGGDRVTIEEPGKTITVIEEAPEDNKKPMISVVKIDRFENLEISDWLNDHTLIVSKENTDLLKLDYPEVSSTYPRSIYTFTIEENKYELIREHAGGNLGGAALSDDRKFLLYHEFTVGDPAFYIMDMETKGSKNNEDMMISSAMSAQWASDGTVTGASYNGGAYSADPAGGVTMVEGLKEESLIVTDKIRGEIYYTLPDETLWKMDLRTREKKSLHLDSVYSLSHSPDGKQILLIQSDGAKFTLAVYDTNGENRQLIDEGQEISAVSWSKDQRMIAYHLKSDENGKTASGLYIHDMLTDETSQIAVDVQPSSTLWSPSGEELVFTESDGTTSSSSVVYLKYSLSN